MNEGVSVVEFLKARVAEDLFAPEMTPMRIIREAEAKRHIIALHEAFGKSGDPSARQMWHATGATLKILANVYKLHNDFQPEWLWGDE